MPAHNAARFIGEAIASVREQTYRNWELIIVDDASTDGTEDIARDFLDQDSRIRYHRVARIGHPAGVRNIGLGLASGTLIAFLDADDRYFAQSLEKLSRPLLTNPALFAVYGFAWNVDEYGNALQQSVTLLPNANASVQTGEPPYVLPPDYGHRWDQIVTSRISNMLPALMIRRGDREAIGPFNENLCGPEDYEFYVRMFLYRYEGVYCLPDYVYRYRIHPASLTKSPAHCQRLLDSCLHIMDWMFGAAGIPAEAHAYCSQAYVACYRYLSRERLLNRQPELARQIALQAFGNLNITFGDFMTYCAPLLIRSLLPTGFDTWMVRLRAEVRRHLYEKIHAECRPLPSFPMPTGKP